MLDSFSFLRKISLTVCSFINFANRRSADSLVVGPPVRNESFFSNYEELSVANRNRIRIAKNTRHRPKEYRQPDKYPLPKTEHAVELCRRVLKEVEMHYPNPVRSYTMDPELQKRLNLKTGHVQIRGNELWHNGIQLVEDFRAYAKENRVKVLLQIA